MPAEPGREENIVSITPLHVLLLGGGILGSGLLATASVSYKQAGKQLTAEGLDASVRRKILPHAVKMLSGSLALTGLAAFGGFCVLESFGFVNREAPTTSSAFRTAWEMLGRPVPPAEQQLAAQAAQHSKP